MRRDMILKSAVIGFLAMLIIWYMFWIAISIVDRQYAMKDELIKLGNQTFWNVDGLDIIWLAFIGTYAILFAGGMTATLVSYSSKIEGRKWLIPSVISAIFTVALIDIDILYGWSQGIAMHNQNPYSGVPLNGLLVLFILLIIAASCFATSAFGGFIAQSKLDYAPKLDEK